MQPAHAKERFENYDPDAPSLSDADARLLIANQEGYAYWGKYESYLHLDPAVQRLIVAVRSTFGSAPHQALSSHHAAWSSPNTEARKTPTRFSSMYRSRPRRVPPAASHHKSARFEP